MSTMNIASWDARFDTPEYIFGTAPNKFLASQTGLWKPGMRALSIADGEGRNSVFLAGQGLKVHAVEGSAKALEKARKLAAERNVTVTFEQADLLNWTYPAAAYDIVAGIFFQFAMPDQCEIIIRGIQQAAAPGGRIILQGYTPAQIGRGNGGPPNPQQMWTANLLREWFTGWKIEHLQEHEENLDEGQRHRGLSAVVDLVAQRP